MADQSSYLDRLDPTAGPFAAHGGPFDPPTTRPCECRALRAQLLVMQQRDELQLDYLTRVIADLAAATRRLARHRRKE